MSEVAWLGGGTGSGKSTVARILAARLGLRLYPIDAFWYARAARLGEAWPSPPARCAGRGTFVALP